MSTRRKWAGLLDGTAVAVLTCAALAAATRPARGSEGRAAPADSGAILQQLVEMQKELKALRDDISQIRQAVTDLSRAGARPAPAAPPVPSAVTLGNDPPLGDAKATVAVVEFSEFECPFCRRFHEETFSKLKETYIDTGQVQYVFRDFPLPMHTQARPAAVAAQCAARQDAFWPMHHALFADQPRLGPELFDEVARRLKLDVDAFLACLKQPETRKEIESDVMYGQKVGVQGTPTFFIGRLKDGQVVDPQRIAGSQPFSAFASAIDPLLK